MTELKIVEDYVINELRKTIANQGHTLTGSLSASLEAHTVETLNGYFINFYYNDYGQPLDTGVKAERIPFNPGSGAKTSKYIDALIQYVKRRMNISGDKEAKGIAFAIAYKHKQEGMSTTASARFSKTGERNNWVNNTLDRIDDKLTILINNSLYAIIDDLMYNALRNYAA
jgi:hypothetical protein